MKLKTVKSAAKRVVKITKTKKIFITTKDGRIVKITKNGLILHRKTSAQHRSTGKSKRVRRDADKTVAFNNADAGPSMGIRFLRKRKSGFEFKYIIAAVNVVPQTASTRQFFLTSLPSK